MNSLTVKRDMGSAEILRLDDAGVISSNNQNLFVGSTDTMLLFIVIGFIDDEFRWWFSENMRML